VPPTTGMQLFEGFPIDVTPKDGEPCIRDVDLGTFLEYFRARKIREIAKGMPAELGKVEWRTRRVRQQLANGVC